MIRKALAEDLDAVDALYDKVHSAEKSGTVNTGWVRGVYPGRDTAAVAVEAGELYVMEEDGNITATAKINKSQEDVYRGIPWLYDAPDEEVIVIHTLVVDLDIKGGGRGKAFVEFCQNLGRESGCSVMRLDTNTMNAAARSLYRGMGFREAGFAPTVFNGIPGVELVMLEKKL